VPVAFLPGTTGRLYTQFSLTIAFSVAISTFNALTLSPALAALLMRPSDPAEEHSNAGGGPVKGLRRFSPFRWFNRNFGRLRDGYQRALGGLLGRLGWAGGAFVAGLVLTFLIFRSVPTGFVPDEDQNYFIIQMLGPQGASLDYMQGIAEQIEARLHTRPEVQDIFALSGFNFSGNGAKRGVIWAALTPISERKRREQSATALVADMQHKLGGIPGAIVVPFLPPPIQGQGATGGFTLELLDQGGATDFTALAQSAEALVGQATAGGRVRGLFSTFSVDDPQYELTIDRDKAKSIAVPLTQINDALGVYLGSQYVNDFDFNNRSYRVYAQASPSFRGQPRDIGRLYVRSTDPAAAGGAALTSLDNLVQLRRGTAPPVISHYNLFRSIELTGGPVPGVASGQALQEMEAAAAKVLPRDIAYEWSGISWEEVRAGRASLIIFALGLAFVFLVLSAQYESFALPLIIILAVPLALLGALGAQKLRGLPNDAFCQIGLLMLVGLASKNAILIVEFAEQLRAKGATARDAVIQAALLRLRPILMTSFAFLLGIFPLVVATGSGANGRRSLGTAVFGGLFLSTLLNLFFTPALYLMMARARERLGRRAPTAEAGAHA